MFYMEWTLWGGGALKYNAGLPGIVKGGGDFKKNIKT